MTRRAFLSMAGLTLAIVGQVIVTTPRGQAFGLILLAAALVVAFLEALESPRSMRTDMFGGVVCGIIGVSLWREPRGWFFLGLAVIWMLSGTLRGRRPQPAPAAGEAGPATVLPGPATGEAVPAASEASPAAVPPGLVTGSQNTLLGVAYGAATAAAGAVAWFLFNKLTGWSFGLIAVAVGHVVGRAVLIGARRGSRSLQAL